MLCWYCYWGWPEPIVKIYQEAVRALNGDNIPLEYGPAHVVWGDENFDSAQSCLDDFELYKGDLDERELSIVRKSLEQLLLIDSEFLDPPCEYDGEHPESYPPPAHWKMRKVEE